MQPNAANAVPADAEAAAAFFKCVTYRCGMMGQACATRFQRRAAGPVLGQIDHLNGCDGCEAGRARAALLDVGIGKRVVRVSIAQPRMSNPNPKFQPVLATRADGTFGSVTALPDPCSACNSVRTRVSRERMEGPYAHLCAECENKIRVRARRDAELKAKAELKAWLAAVAHVCERLGFVSGEVTKGAQVAAQGFASMRELLGKPIIMPPVFYVPAAPCSSCGHARKHESIEGRADWCARCNDKAEQKAKAKARKAAAKPRKSKAEKAKAIAEGMAATKAQAKADVEAAAANTQPRLPDPIPACSKCGRERFFRQKRRREVGDPTACSRCNRHVHRAIQRQERYGEKIAALKQRLAAAEAGETLACPRCLRESLRNSERQGTPLEPFCSACIGIGRRYVQDDDDALLLAWLSEHPSRRDHGSACRGCGAMRHCAAEGLNGEWCSRCRKNAANTVRWHGVPVTEELVHQQLLRNEARAKRSKRLPTGRVAAAVAAAVTEAVTQAEASAQPAPSVGTLVYFDPTLAAYERSMSRWRKWRQTIDFFVHRDGEYLAIVAAEAG